MKHHLTACGRAWGFLYRAAGGCCSIVISFVGLARRGGLARRLAGVLAVLGVLSLGGGLAGVAGARSTVEEGSAVPADEISVLEERVEEQDAVLEEQIGDLSAVGAELEEAQARVDGARVRAGELGEQTRALERELAARRETFRAAKAGYEERARAAYKGGELEGLSFLLDGLLGSAGDPVRIADPRVAEILLEGRESLEAYLEHERILQNTSRQISQKKQAYEAALREERSYTEELGLREEELEESIAQISSYRSQMQARLREFRAAERARILEQRAATGGGGVRRGLRLRDTRGGGVA